jgi:type I restriction enzyme S subunit
METAEKETLRIDKTNWTSVKFGDVAFEPKENAKDIYNEGIEHVVGLEHIDSENIHLTRSGKLEETTTFSKKFRKGDVLFGRRRAYLKKAALADFDGICSGDITVFRAKKNLMPGLLPFIVNNEKFFDYAVKHSAGGLSPRVKFKDLANYEFLLPPKDQQAQLAELLWAMDEVIEMDKEVLEKIGDLRESYHKEHFVDYRKSKFRIGEYSNKVGSGVTPLGGSKVYLDKGVRLIRSQNVLFGEFDFSDIAYISDEIDQKMISSRVEHEDVLLNITGASIGRCSVYLDEERANVNQHVCIIRTTSELNPWFLAEFINSKYGQNQIQLLQAGGNREGLNFANIKLMKFPEYDIDAQNDLMEKYSSIRNSIFSARVKIEHSQSLQKSLINQVFG